MSAINQPGIVLCTLVLNEMEWLENLYLQHKDWPGLLKWVFVESADRVYEECNPEMVSPQRLSVDGTTEYLQKLCTTDDRIVHIPFGMSKARDIAQGKCESRNQYLALIESRRLDPHYVIILDGDEFYATAAQAEICSRVLYNDYPSAFSFAFRHPWRPPSLSHEPLFQREVIDGFWAIPHTRFWRYERGMRYSSNHNTPETPGGTRMDRTLFRYATPQCVHTAFSSKLRGRHAKHLYYRTRGEGVTDARGWYVESRNAWELWKPGDTLPRGARVINYSGPVPECFQGTYGASTSYL